MAFLTACSSRAENCKPCGAALSLEPAGIVPAGAGEPTGFRVCLDGACYDVAPPEIRGPDIPPRTYGIGGTRAGQHFRTVTVVALAGTRVLGKASGIDLAIPPSRRSCDCGGGFLRLDRTTGLLAIART